MQTQRHYFSAGLKKKRKEFGKNGPKPCSATFFKKGKLNGVCGFAGHNESPKRGEGF